MNDRIEALARKFDDWQEPLTDKELDDLFEGIVELEDSSFDAVSGTITSLKWLRDGSSVLRLNTCIRIKERIPRCRPEYKVELRKMAKEDLDPRVQQAAQSALDRWS
ncbi:hypothetical protein EPO04_00435 [Patescibacteria group bacterium]|nr:MAG: hypothetical protein EPO04_00435 [Patescibacteria group bacterium]